MQWSAEVVKCILQICFKTLKSLPAFNAVTLEVGKNLKVFLGKWLENRELGFDIISQYMEVTSLYFLSDAPHTLQENWTLQNLEQISIVSWEVDSMSELVPANAGLFGFVWFRHSFVFVSGTGDWTQVLHTQLQCQACLVLILRKGVTNSLNCQCWNQLVMLLPQPCREVGF